MMKSKKSYFNTSQLLLELSSGWHKYQYRKFEYLEEGCINKKIQKELKEKKLYHYQKYIERSAPFEENARA